MRLGFAIVASTLFGCMQMAFANQSSLSAHGDWVEHSTKYLELSFKIEMGVNGLVVLVDNETLNSCEALNDPHGSDFDWSAITSDTLLERCLLKLARNLEDVTLMAQWLEAQGFSSVDAVSSTEGRIWLNATWDTVRSGEPVPFFSARSFIHRLFYQSRNYVVQVVYESGIPTSTSAHYIVV